MPFKTKLAALVCKVKEILEKSPRCHDWEHTERVLQNARILAEKEKCSVRQTQIVEIAALLHDIARADEIAIKGKLCHATRGSVMAREILAAEGFAPKIAEAVASCVKRHRHRSDDRPQTLPEKIVYDADKLDSLGAIGLARAFLFAGRVGAKAHNKKKQALAAPEYSVDDTAYREYLVKLRILPGRMLTHSGRKIARGRLKFMSDFFKTLDLEVFGPTTPP